MPLSDPELLQLRADTESWFTDTVDTFRVTTADDQFGGETHDEQPFLQGVRCSVESGAAHEVERAFIGKIEDVQIYTVTFPALTDVRLGDHLVITSQGDLHLRVQVVLAPESWEIERRVIASELGEHNEP